MQASKTTSKTPHRGDTEPRKGTGQRQPRLPHEHDESADSQTQEQPRPVIQQAHDDIERGLEDTDLRSHQGQRKPAVPPGTPRDQS